MTIADTARLRLSRLTLDDASFIRELMTDPSYVRYIGDRGVRTLDDARAYLTDKLIASYDHFGFGLYRTALEHTDVPIGICGLVQREALDDVDIGFAFLPRYRGQGYALEAATAVLAHGRTALGLSRIVAITTPDNHRSIQLLTRLGLHFERMVRLPGDEHDCKLFATDG